MLAGFFTYKVGVLGRSSVALWHELRGTPDAVSPAQVIAEGDAPAPVADRAQARAEGGGEAGAPAVQQHQSGSAAALPADGGDAPRLRRTSDVVLPRAPAAAAHAVDSLVERQLRGL